MICIDFFKFTCWSATSSSFLLTGQINHCLSLSLQSLQNYLFTSLDQLCISMRKQIIALVQSIYCYSRKEVLVGAKRYEPSCLDVGQRLSRYSGSSINDFTRVGREGRRCAYSPPGLRETSVLHILYYRDFCFISYSLCLQIFQEGYGAPTFERGL